MATQKSIAFHTLGCKLNYSETSSIKKQFEDEGYNVVPFDDYANYYVLNTCSVTEFADRKCRYEVRRAKKHNPEGKIIVIGCYAQLKPKEISEIDGVDLVLGAGEKFNILKHIDSLNNGGLSEKFHETRIQEVNSFIDAFSFGDRTRSFLKVQDGCDYKCSFCTIPLARGKSRSDTIQNVVQNAHKIADLGVKEIVLTGVNIGDFGIINEKRESSFLDLIKALDEVNGIERFRISSIEPNLCSDEIIEFVASSKRFMPHFHMPLQSGSDVMLKAMRRRYKRKLYSERVEHIKTLMPHCCIGVDLIVGFPGETYELFKESYEFINQLDISYLHVFTYSERANTHAPSLGNPVPMNMRRERNKMLRILSEKKQRKFYTDHLGREFKVLFESEKSANRFTGFTSNYIKVECESQDHLEGAILECNLSEVEGNGLVRVMPSTLV